MLGLRLEPGRRGRQVGHRAMVRRAGDLTELLPCGAPAAAAAEVGVSREDGPGPAGQARGQHWNLAVNSQSSVTPFFLLFPPFFLGMAW